MELLFVTLVVTIVATVGQLRDATGGYNASSRG